MAGDKTKRAVKPQPRGDKNRFPSGKYTAPTSFQVRKGDLVEVVQHLPDVYPEMRGRPPIVLIE